MPEIPIRRSSNTTRRSALSIYSTERDLESVSSLSCRICLHNHIPPCRCLDDKVAQAMDSQFAKISSNQRVTSTIQGQIRDFSPEDYIDGKNDPRLDDCGRYSLVPGKRVLRDANLNQQVLNTVSLYTNSSLTED
nr:3-oxoacyl-[acyl-carrier-protein] synthase I, chloroplastic [Ipomoea trifida]